MGMKPVLSLFLLVCIHLSASAQLGSWTGINVRGKFGRKFLYMGEAQLRSTKFYHDFFYYEVKGAIGYNPGKQVAFMLGSGFYETYTPAGNFVRPVVSSEIRLWEEATFKHSIWRLFFEHRYRIEQRFFVNNGTYRNRFRYRLAAAIPLNKPQIDPGTVFLSCFNELFLSERAPYFERNRIFAGVGFKHKIVTVQSGYLHQFDYSLGNSLNRHFLQTFLIFEINSRKLKDVLPFGQD